MDWSSIPSLSALRAFVATAQEGGFTAAAQALGVTPAAVAQQVRGLEAELGLALVRRAGRGVALTEQGAQLAEKLARAFGGMASAISEMQDAEDRRGLRVTAAPTVVDGFLLAHMGDFWRRNPGVEVSLIPGPNDVDLAHSSFDLAIRAGTGDYPGLVPLKLTDTRWVVAGAPKLFGKTGFDPAKLRWAFVRNLPWQRELIRHAGLDPDAVRTKDLGNLRQLLELVRDGKAVSIFTEFTLRADVAARRLRVFDLPAAPEIAYWALTLPGPRREAVSRFTLWLQKVFTDDAPPPVPKSDGFPM